MTTLDIHQYADKYISSDIYMPVISSDIYIPVMRYLNTGKVGLESEGLEWIERQRA